MNVLQSEATAARRRIPVYLVDATDGFTPEVGITPTGAEIQTSENGAAFVNFAGTWTEIANGLYYYEFTAAELSTLGFVTVKVNVAGVRDFIGTAQVAIARPGRIGLDGIDAASLATGAVAEMADGVWDEVLTGGTHNVPSSAGRRLRQLATGQVLREDVFQAGSTASALVLDASASAVDEFYQFLAIVIVDGAAAGQMRIISDYDGATRTASITPDLVTAAPGAGDAFEVIAMGPAHAATSAPGYAHGAVWVDTNAANTGTRLFVDGTAMNPVSTITAAKTIADALGLVIFDVEPGSSIALVATMQNYEFIGAGYSVALGGQDIGGSVFVGATVTGVATGALPVFRDCAFGAVTLPPCTMWSSSLGGVMTMGSAGDYFLNDCRSAIAGVAAPTLTFVANANANLRAWSGGIQNETMAATNNMSLEGNGQFIEGTCSGGTVAVRGNFTVSGITNITLSDDARIDVDQVSAAVDASTVLIRILGLVQDNFMLDEQTYDAENLLLTGRIRVFASAGALAAATRDAADGTDSEIARYNVTVGSAVAGQANDYRVAREL